MRTGWYSICIMGHFQENPQIHGVGRDLVAELELNVGARVVHIRRGDVVEGMDGVARSTDDATIVLDARLGGRQIAARDTVSASPEELDDAIRARYPKEESDLIFAVLTTMGERLNDKRTGHKKTFADRLASLNERSAYIAALLAGITLAGGALSVLTFVDGQPVRGALVGAVAGITGYGTAREMKQSAEIRELEEDVTRIEYDAENSAIIDTLRHSLISTQDAQAGTEAPAGE